MSSNPDPSSVSGPRPRIASAKIVGNMREIPRPTVIRPYIAAGPVTNTAISDPTMAMVENSASTFSGAMARISAALNIGLLDVRRLCDDVDKAWREGRVPLNAAEGFIRQLIGWREYVRGIYWQRMPAYAGLNHLNNDRALPAFYWTGRTRMRCMAQAIGQTLRLGYAHHIQRLMVTGNFALLAGIVPTAICEWYLAVYVDAVEWVELPNTLGMSQFADGGRMTSKPYVASGAYIERMSGGQHCARCPYQPGVKVGPRACPYTTLYWDFLLRHRTRFARHPRLGAQVRHLDRLSAQETRAIQSQAQALRERFAR